MAIGKVTISSIAKLDGWLWDKDLRFKVAVQRRLLPTTLV